MDAAIEAAIDAMQGHPVTLTGWGSKHEGEIRVMRYENDRPAIVVMATDGSGERIGIATVNMPELEQRDGELFVKTWSENEEWVHQLLDTGFFEDTCKKFFTGHVHGEVWRIKI